MSTKDDIVIPRVIMQTWKTKELPDKWKPSQVSVNSYMNNWKYVLMTDDNNKKFIEDNHPDFIDTYNSFPYPIQRADAIRYAWLYKYGGIYMDCDIELLGNIDHLFYEESSDVTSAISNKSSHIIYTVPSANNASVYTNAFIAATPGHPVFLKMIEDMKASSMFKTMTKIEKHWHVMESTGPMMFTRMVKQYSPYHKIVDASVLNPYTICDTTYNRPHALMRPLCGSSWVGPVGYVWQSMYCYRNLIMAIVIFFMLVAVYMLVKRRV